VQKGVDKVRKFVWMYLALAVGLLIAAPSAKAILLGPGGSGAPDVLSVPTFPSAGATLVAYTTGTFSSGLISGSYEAAVIKDTSGVNPFGIGDFDFEIAINPNTGPDAIGRVTTTNFAGWLTDVGYDNLFCGILYCGSATLVAPTSVDRGVLGDTIGFNFGSFVAPTLASGDSSYILEVATNATSYTKGTINILDGGAATVTGFAPAAPEPATLSILGIGLLSLFGLRKK